MYKCNFKQVARSTLLLIVMIFAMGNFKVQAQVTTNGGSGLAATYPSLNAAITALNTATISSPVTITLTGNETAPVGGYSITAQGTTTNTIIIEGVSSTITASTGLTAGALNDAIFKLVGADNVTIRTFTMQENAANTTVTAASNNMTEWGVALLYATTTDGCQNISILNNTISLGATYQNAFGVYANSTHSGTAPTTSATATTVTGGNHNLAVKGNVISNVHMGVVVIGPSAAADQNDGLSIGGTTLSDGNTITFGSTSTIATSGYANLSITVNGILVRNTKNATVSNNSLTSNGTVVLGTINGIQFPAFTNTPTGTFTQNINNNTLNLRSNFTTGTVVGITQPSGSASTTSICNINSNNFTNFGHSIAGASGTLTFITTASTHFSTNITGNTFTNLTVNTTGSVTFISHSLTMPANGTKLVSNNAIVTAFTKTGAGGTVTFMTTSASSPNSASAVYSNNTISNITLTGATTFVGMNDTDGSSSGANKVFSGNTIGSITTGAASMTGLTCSYWGGTSSAISGNSILNLNGQGSITGITLGNTFAGATNSVISGNNIAGLFSTGTGGAVVAITCSNTSTGISIASNNIGTLSSTAAAAVTGISVTGATATTVSKNVICTLTGSNASATVNGILVSGGTLVTLTNNVIGGLDAPIANAANPVNGINVTGGTTVNVYYNTVRISGTSAAALFGSSALSVSTTPTVAVRNNILVNAGTPIATGLCVAFRRSTTSLTTFDNASNNNDLVGSTIFTDGTNSAVTLVAYQTLMTPRESLSINVVPTFLSTACGNANFLHLDPSVFTPLESGAVNIAGLTTDIDGQTRAGNAGYTGSGSAPDMGADEVESALPLCSGVDAGTISPATVNLCTSSATTTMNSTGVTLASGISLQWKVASTVGGPYVDVVGGTGANTATYTTPTLPAGTYYFVLLATCSVGPVTDLTNEVTVVVNTNPTVTATPSSATYCSPGSAVSVTASGANTYAWSPATGLSATTGATVSATPSSNTTYTITGTSLNGCTGTATVTIGVAEVPSISVATATPSSVCSGGASQLNVVGSTTTSYSVSSIPFAAVATPGTGVTVLANSGTAVTTLASGTLDDGGWANLALPFGFNMFGTSYSSFAVSSNGFMVLGAGAPNTYTGYSNTFPSASCGRPSIGAVYSDLDFRTAGTINYFTTGTAPNRQLVVNWSGGNFYSATGSVGTQIILYEGSNVIEVHTTNSTGTNSAVEGIQNAAGTTAYTVSGRNNATWAVATPDAYRWAPTGGTVTYVWSPATFLNNTAIANPIASNITSTTTYTVIASNLGCTSTSGVTVSAGSVLSSSASLSTSSTVCSGTNVVITGAGIGGGAPYTYAWSGPNSYIGTTASINLNAITVAQAGTYTVVVTDNCGATSTSSVSITVNALPVVATAASSSVYCSPGTGVTLTATGATNYAWTPSASLSSATGASVIATPSSTTSYTVVGTDGNGCSASATVSVAYAPAIASVSAVATPATICTNGNSNLVATAALSPFTYCASTHSSGCSGDNIAAVVLGSINNTTGTTCGGTTHQTYFAPSATTTTTLSVLSASNTLSVTFGTDGNQYFGAWIDYNQDGTLDASEFLGASGNAGSSGTTSISFAVPAGAYNGTTRLRIIGGNDAAVVANQACGASSSAWGETQDYDVVITNGVNLYTLTWSPATNLSATSGSTVSATNVASTVTYTATATTLAGCSNSGTVTLTVNPPSASTTTITACGSYTWTNGTTYNASGTFTQTLVNSVGCDSIATLHLTINQPTSSTVTATACNSYTWTQNGTTYTVSGSYPVVLAGANAHGCDSTITLNLTINQPTSSTVTASACGSYTWAQNGTTYMISGSFPVVLVGANAHGCDSTITLNLTINQPTSSTVTASACGSYTWAQNGATYNTSGSYSVVLAGANANGCDSTVTLNLTINQPTSSTVTASACSSYTWAENGATYNTSGSYSAVLAGANANGCDSTITLNLTINQPTTSTVTASACGSYTWAENGATYNTSGSYSVVLAGANANGCDSTVTLNLTINSPATSTDVQAACDFYIWMDGNTYVASNNTATYTIVGGAANGCDSIITLNLTITPTPIATAVDNGNATITASSGTTYQWIDCATGAAIAGETAQTFTASVNGSYAVVVTNGSCSDTSACVVIDYIGIKESIAAFVSVYPNPTSNEVTVSMNAAHALVEVMDAQGKILQRTTIQNGGKVSLGAYETGIYYVKITTEVGSVLERISKQ